MKLSIVQKIQHSLRSVNQWYLETPDRALEQAYNAALQIKAIEDEHFNGKKISADNGDYGESVMAYFQAELRKNLNVAKRRIAEFKMSQSFVSTPEKKTANSNGANPAANSNGIGIREQPSIILEKLKFIDQVIAKYKFRASGDKADPSLSLMVIPKNVNLETSQANLTNAQEKFYSPNDVDTIINKAENLSDQTGVLPRSILRTFSRLSRELNPKAEEDVVRKFRSSQAKTAISLRFVLLLIVVPLLTFQLTKLFIVGPLVDLYYESPKNTIGVFLNHELKEAAFRELQTFEEELKFNILIGRTPEISEEVREAKLKEKANELAEQYSQNSSGAIKNVFSDLFSLGAFALVILTSRREIEILKSFIDDIIYGLSDSAKAFIIILFTDVFVGFHSPHGWEVILEGVSRHLGLPENRQFIYLFIATFPVVLDTIFKYWIFRYLNRISPSAVATYRNMNE
jgi:CemA family